MIIKNVSGSAFVITSVGKTMANNGQITVPDKLRQDDDIAAAITAGNLQVISFSSDASSIVAQEEVGAAVAASHTHANAAELDLVTDGDHDVIAVGNPHSVTGLEVPYVAANPANWLTAPPADMLTAIQRLEAQVQVLTAGPIP